MIKHTANLPLSSIIINIVIAVFFNEIQISLQSLLFPAPSKGKFLVKYLMVFR